MYACLLNQYWDITKQLQVFCLLLFQNNPTELRSLISKWRCSSQAMLYELQSSLSTDSRKLSLTQLIDNFGLDDKLLHYVRTEEDFTDAWYGCFYFILNTSEDKYFQSLNLAFELHCWTVVNPWIFLILKDCCKKYLISISMWNSAPIPLSLILNALGLKAAVRIEDICHTYTAAILKVQ